MATLASPGLARYSRVAVRLHWLIALPIVVNLLLGFSRGEFERPVRAAMMAVHKATGLTILVLLALHIGGALKHHLAGHRHLVGRMAPWLRARDPAS